jgi:2-dehydropantoate 2-reductase
VANERAALRRFRNVYAMLVMVPAQFMEPGCVQSHSRLQPGLLVLGVYPGGTDALAQEISERLEAANISSRADSKVMRLKYAKLLMNLNNGLEAVLPEDEDADDILTMLRDEGRACFRAAAIDCASADEVRQRREGVFDFGDIPGSGRVGGSSRQSILRGTGDIETDYLNGEITMLGRMHGVPTPANAVIQRVSNAVATRKDRSATIAADELRRLIAAEQV